jgi:hypothetical protein
MGRIYRSMMLCSVLAACASSSEQLPDVPALPAAGGTGAAMSADVDHVIVAIDSLERGIAELRQKTGVTPAFGGVHPGRGTQNALLSLGPRVYLELIAPNPADSAGPTMVRNYAHLRTVTPGGWALHTGNADSLRAFAVARGLSASEVRAGSRRRDDGSMLSWKTVNPWGVNQWLLPFFIEWGAGSAHPSTTSPGGCTLASIELHSVSADSLRAMLRAVSVEVPVSPAEADRMSITLDCPTGRVRLP